MVQTTEFGKWIKKKLIDKELTQNWLISEVKKRSGKYFDSSYLFKIMVGKYENKEMVSLIKSILEG